MKTKHITTQRESRAFFSECTAMEILNGLEQMQADVLKARESRLAYLHEITSAGTKNATVAIAVEAESLRKLDQENGALNSLLLEVKLSIECATDNATIGKRLVTYVERECWDAVCSNEYGLAVAREMRHILISLSRRIQEARA